MAFKLAVISKETGVFFVAAYGEATAADFSSGEHLQFKNLLGDKWAQERVVLDMDAVPYVDSSAIGWLINIQKQFRNGGGALALHSVQPHVRNILSLLKIEKVVPIGNDGPAAKKLLPPAKRRSRAAQSA